MRNVLIMISTFEACLTKYTSNSTFTLGFRTAPNCRTVLKSQTSFSSCENLRPYAFRPRVKLENSRVLHSRPLKILILAQKISTEKKRHQSAYLYLLSWGLGTNFMMNYMDDNTTHQVTKPTH